MRIDKTFLIAEPMREVSWLNRRWSVLRFPEQTRRVGDDAQLIPWETSLIHTGMASLNQRLTGEKDDAETKQIRARIAELRKELAAATRQTAQVQKANTWRQYEAAMKAERPIVAKLDAELTKVDQYEIRVANALWGEKTYPFRQDFVDTLNKYYRTGVGALVIRPATHPRKAGGPRQARLQPRRDSLRCARR